MSELFLREWGAGRPVIAMAPLGLESSAFTALGETLAARGMRTLAVDLPGFGRTPAPSAPLTPAVLAAPVIALARSLETPPIVLGVSLGGRIALEVALTAPETVRAAVAIAPYLPWLRGRFWLGFMRLLDPGLADWLPFERAWPVLRWLAQALEQLPYLRDDALAQAGARAVYYFSCPATRASFLSAARELALDPAHGPDGFWARLDDLAVPAAFVWGERDQLVSVRFARAVARSRAQPMQLLLPCVGHWLNGPHHRCLAATLADVVPELLRQADAPSLASRQSTAGLVMRRCVVTGEGAPGGTVVVPEESHA